MSRTRAASPAGGPGIAPGRHSLELTGKELRG
jgi:hypothetical protein